MAILAASDRYTLFAAQPVTASVQYSPDAPCGAVPQAVVELSTDGANNAALTFWFEGSNDGGATHLPAETVSDIAGATKAGNDIPATIYRHTHILPANIASMSWAFPHGFALLRCGFTGGNTNGLLTVKLQLARGNG